MPYNVIVKEEAFADALTAYLYYEHQLEGLGDRFIAELNFRYRQLAENPHYFSYVYADKGRNRRDVLLKKFPYLVVFEVIGSDVIVYSVLNTSREARKA
ncbi:MAG: type II toxin-antitoxin system RelE/ParE family toxin [Bacteroidota bacterium]